MARIVVSPQAETDVVSIARYLVEQSQSGATGQRFILGMEETLKMLSRHPEAGRRRPDLQANVRSFPFARCLIYYRALGDDLEVLRVLHTSRDAEEMFRKGIP